MTTNKIIIIPVLTVVVLAAIVGCKQQEDSKWGWEHKRPELAREIFSHEVHKNVLEKEGFGCFVCHPMEVGIETEEMEEVDVEELIRTSKEVFFPGKETCHFCHYNPEAGNVARGDCNICHTDTADIIPANHNFNWIMRHSVFSKADAGSCESCHTPRYCEDCHKRRDLPTRRVHDRNFRFIHSIEARANPRQCSNCHEFRGFCEKCHIEGGYER